MKNVLLLLLVALLMGEVSGAFQVGSPASTADGVQGVQGAAVQEPADAGTGQIIFSALIAIGAVVLIIFIMQHER